MTEDPREPADVRDEPPEGRAPARAGDEDGSPRARPSEESQRDEQDEEALAPFARDISDLVE